VDSLDAVSLAPVSVHPQHQRLGIGSALIRRGLDECRAQNEPAIFVLGHADYYPRFGFSSETAKPFGPFKGESWMALELIPHCLEGLSGDVKYAAAFGL